MDLSMERQAFLASALGAAGGIGGGGILVPLLTSIGGVTVHHAIPLTQVCVFGASIMNFTLVRGTLPFGLLTMPPRLPRRPERRLASRRPCMPP